MTSRQVNKTARITCRNWTVVPAHYNEFLTSLTRCLDVVTRGLNSLDAATSPRFIFYWCVCRNYMILTCLYSRKRVANQWTLILCLTADAGYLSMTALHGRRIEGGWDNKCTWVVAASVRFHGEYIAIEIERENTSHMRPKGTSSIIIVIHNETLATAIYSSTKMCDPHAIHSCCCCDTDL